MKKYILLFAVIFIFSIYSYNTYADIHGCREVCVLDQDGGAGIYNGQVGNPNWANGYCSQSAGGRHYSNPCSEQWMLGGNQMTDYGFC